MQLQIWDFPGQLDFTDDAFDTEQIFAQCGALIYVIDAQVPAAAVDASIAMLKSAFAPPPQDDYSEALSKLHKTVLKAHKVLRRSSRDVVAALLKPSARSQINPTMTYEVFIHKVDSINDEHKMDTQRGIQQQAMVGGAARRPLVVTRPLCRCRTNWPTRTSAASTCRSTSLRFTIIRFSKSVSLRRRRGRRCR